MQDDPPFCPECGVVKHVVRLYRKPGVHCPEFEYVCDWCGAFFNGEDVTK